MASKRPVRTKKSATPEAPAVPSEALSICVYCSKHESLKRFVGEHGAIGHRCGICKRTDVVASKPEAYRSLSSLIRALVRFYYDEWTYNGHWGGDDEPAGLLSRLNPIVEHKSKPGFSRLAEDSEEFLVGNFDSPYPAYDEGIALYAGHHEKYGRLPTFRRHQQFPIPNIQADCRALG